MKNFLLCLFLILGANLAAAESIVTVNIKGSADAVWIMEKNIPLTNNEFNEWESVIKTGQNFSRYRKIPEYEDLYKIFQNFAWNFSNRSMEVETFNISYDTKKTISGGIGIIKYTFVWKNFSYYDSERLIIGDAFPGGVFLLSPENQLRIMIPEGYDVEDANPVFDKRNGNLLVWDGTLSGNFSAGQPYIVLISANFSKPSNINDLFSGKWLLLGGLIIFIFIIAFVAFLYWKKRAYSIQKEHDKENKEKLEKNSIEQKLINTELDPSIPLFNMDINDLDDEEMVKQFLLRKGGQAYQSDIVEHSGLSKSKISMVLSKMKDDGKIIKIRKGKENLIRLQPPVIEDPAGLIKPPEKEGVP